MISMVLWFYGLYSYIDVGCIVFLLLGLWLSLTRIVMLVILLRLCDLFSGSLVARFTDVLVYILLFWALFVDFVGV